MNSKGLLKGFPFFVFLLFSCLKDKLPNQENEFQEVTFYAVEIESTEGGSINDKGGNIISDSQLTVTATPDEGYRFTGWSNGQTENPLTINVKSDLKLTAIFERFSPLSFLNLDDTLYVQYRGSVIIDDRINLVISYHRLGKGILKDLVSDTTRENNVAIINLDFNGEIKWIKSLETDYLYARPSNIISTKDDKILISGYLAPSSNTDINKNQEFFIGKWDSDGNLNWINRIPTNSNGTSIQHYTNNLIEANSSFNSLISYSAVVHTDAQGGIFPNTTFNPVEPYFLMNLNNFGNIESVIKLNNREVYDLRIEARSIAELRGTNGGKLVFSGWGSKSNSNPLWGIGMLVLNNQYDELERKWNEPFDEFIGEVRIEPLNDGGFIHYINMDNGNSFKKVFRRYNSDFEIVWEKIVMDELRFTDFEVEEDYIYITGWLNGQYIAAHKYNTSNGNKIWEYKQTTTSGETILYENLITDKEVLLIGFAQDREGFFVGNPPSVDNDKNIMIIRLNKETGEVLN